MQKLKHLFLSVAIFFIGSFMLTGCLEELHEAVPGKALANIYPVSSLAYFANVTQEISIDIGIYANEGVLISSITMTKQLFLVSGDSSAVVIYSLTVAPTDTLIKQVQSKAEIFADVPINDLVLTENDLAAGDYWEYTYKFSLDNDLVLKNTSGTVVTFLCPSSLAGTFDVVAIPWCGTPISMEATWVEVGDGVYTTTDFTYGAYFACYGGWGGTPDGSLKINDVCNLIFPTGESQWQDKYTYSNGTTAGISFAFDWVNDYGESGSVTLIRQDGQDWPTLRTE